MGKRLTAAEERTLRYLLKKGGYEQPPALSPRKGGRPKHDDAFMLASLELFVRSTARSYGINRDAALRMLVKPLGQLGEQGGFFKQGQAQAVIARLKRKLREGGFDKRPAKTLVPPEWLERGVDPEKFISFPFTKTDLRGIDPEKFMPRKLPKLKRVGLNERGGSKYVVVESDD